MDKFTSLLKQYPVKKFAAGEMILYQGEVPPAAYVVKSGLVKTYNISSKGDEKPISFSAAHELLSSAWVFDKTSSSLFFYEAHTDSELYYVPREELKRLLNDNPGVLAFLLDRYVTLNAAKSLQIHALEYSKAADKILHMLFYLTMVHGKEVPDGTTVIDVPLTQQDLANLLGLTRETTGIELLKLKRSGMLSLSRKRYRLNKSKLVQLLGETEFEDLSI